nr:MAG TPA: hypothetical protein [Inoviridae sp.]
MQRTGARCVSGRCGSRCRGAFYCFVKLCRAVWVVCVFVRNIIYLLRCILCQLNKAMAEASSQGICEAFSHLCAWSETFINRLKPRPCMPMNRPC